MTGTRVAALVIIPLAIVVGVAGGRYWHATHPAQVAAVVDRLAPTVPTPAAPPPVASPAPPAEPAPATAAPAPQATPQVAARDPDPAIGALPQIVPPKSPAPDGKLPSFDVVRVEPQGDTVVAGKGAPNAKVALLSGGKVVGEAQSDANGQFVILPERLAPGDHALTLRQTPDGKPASESAQSVAVSVPQPGKDASKVVVALAEPGRATKLLSPPPGATASPAAPAAPPGKVIIRSAELENGSGVYVSGAASAGTSVHIYLNDSHIADVVAGADGAWSVRVKHGLTGGHYNVRADATGTDGKVASRAEVPFDVPVLMAQAPRGQEAKPQEIKPQETKPQAAPPAPRVASATPGAAAPASTAPKPETTPASSETAKSETAKSDPAKDETTAPATETADAASSASPAAATPAAPGGADATIDTVATARVTRGDNLWNISRYRLGDGQRYTQIYAANVDQIHDPNLIYPGQVFVVPSSH